LSSLHGIGKTQLDKGPSFGERDFDENTENIFLRLGTFGKTSAIIDRQAVVKYWAAGSSASAFPCIDDEQVA